MNWDLYEKRVNINGITSRERLINETKDTILNKILTSPSLKTVTINNVEQNLIINSTKIDTEKTFNTLPDEVITLGNIISWNNTKWIVTSLDLDNELYYTGKIQQCNHLFRFQLNSPTIYEYYGIFENPYSNDLAYGNVVNMTSNKVKFILPYNNNTKKIHIDKRFVLDITYDELGNQIPVIYKVVGISSETTNYGNGKLLVLNAELDVANTTDNITQMIANYITETTPTEITPQPTRCEILGRDDIRVGGSSRTYTSIFYQDDIVVDGIQAEWNLITLPEHSIKYTLTPNGNSVVVSVENDLSLIGSDFKLVLTDNLDIFGSCEKIIKAVSIYG